MTGDGGLLIADRIFCERHCDLELVVKGEGK